MIPVPHTGVNTASRGASMTVVGQVKNVKMFLLNEYLVESILVLEGLSHPVNIGLKFLQKNYAVIYLTPEKVTLEMGQVQVELVQKGSCSAQGVVSTRIKRRATGPGPRVDSVQT